MRDQLTERARDLRKCSTRAERTIWYWLRNRYLSGFKFRRQHPVDGYILDFFCPQLKLCIEIDGCSHDTEERVVYDERRTRMLRARGITVLRLRNEHIAEQPDGAWSLIVEAVETAAGIRPAQSPLPAAGSSRRGEG